MTFILNAEMHCTPIGKFLFMVAFYLDYSQNSFPGAHAE